MKHGKKYVDSFKAIDKAKQYDAPEALELAAKGAKAKRNAGRVGRTERD